jgi:hypothetical protein
MGELKLKFILACLPQWTGTSASALPPQEARLLEARNSTFYGQVNITGFPACAVANCITSDQLSPSRLGCIAPELTTDCLCINASTPLACAPSGPSDQDNCWYYLENWFAGVCQGSVALIEPATMPQCIQSCVLDYLVEQGCPTQTRNCFCILPRQPLLDATVSCLSQNCLKKLQSSFSPTTWHDNTCLLGHTDDYDQAAYDKYANMVYDLRVAMSVILGIGCSIMIIIGIGRLVGYGDIEEKGCWLIVIAILLLLIILIPIYTAL